MTYELAIVGCLAVMVRMGELIASCTRGDILGHAFNINQVPMRVCYEVCNPDGQTSKGPRIHITSS